MSDVYPLTSPIGATGGLLDPTLISLARDLAYDIYDLPRILKNYNLSNDEWIIIRDSAGFKEFVRQASAEFNSAHNGEQRNVVKAAAMVEAAWPVFWADMINPRIPLPQRTDLLKTIAKIAKLGGDGVGPGGVNTATPFQVRIFLGATAPAMTIDGDAIEPAGGPSIELG